MAANELVIVKESNLSLNQLHPVKLNQLTTKNLTAFVLSEEKRNTTCLKVV